jgi:hypothetical protein
MVGGVVGVSLRACGARLGAEPLVADEEALAAVVAIGLGCTHDRIRSVVDIDVP